MSVNAVGGYPQFGTGSGTGLIPELFASEFNIEYWATTLMPQICTGRFYEGLLNHGDKVTVAAEPSITINNYEKGQTLAVDTPTSTPITMTVDRAKYFNVALDDVDRKQSHLDLAGKYVDVAMRQITQDVETDFFADIIDDAAVGNKGNTAGVTSGRYDLGSLLSPIDLTVDNVTQVITRARAVLEEQNAFVPGKVWIVLPVWARYLLVNSELKQAYLTGDSKSVLRSGLLGEIDGMNIYVSNLLSQAGEGDVFYCHAGNMDAISHISQLNNTENIRSTTTFADLFRGLMVYDWKVRKPEGLVEMVIQEPTA